MRLRGSAIFKKTALPKAFVESADDGILLFDATDSLPEGDPSKFVAVSPKGMIVDDIVNLMHAKGVNHVIPAGSAQFASELEISSQFIQKSKTFLKNPEHLLFTDGFDKSYARTFKGHDEKSTIMKEVKLFLQDCRGTSTVAMDILLIADELLTNALLNAPPVKENHLFLLADGTRIVIGCRDLYGSLETKGLLARVNETYKRGKGKSIRNDSARGAGIGFRMIIDASQGIYVAVIPDVETLVCCSLPLGLSARETASLGKSFHIY